MSEKKETAVEWLVKELNEKIDFIPMNKWDEIRDIVKLAKQMEEQQIRNAYCKGELDYVNKDVKTSKQYYKETYGE